jgi:hypothetical protein
LWRAVEVIAFIKRPQGAVIEKILRHCGLQRASAPFAPLAGHCAVHDADGDLDEPQEAIFVDIRRL